MEQRIWHEQAKEWRESHRNGNEWLLAEHKPNQAVRLRNFNESRSALFR